MRSRIVLAAAAALLAVNAWPALAAAPFGSLDPRIQPIGSGNASWGIMQGTGWACDASGIATVDLFVDGIPEARAVINQRRPGVTRKFPSCHTPGFTWAIDTTQFLNGMHALTAVATANNGGTVTLGPVQVEFMNNESALKPFGLITFPDPDTVEHGRCNLSDPTRRYSVVEGVAFDSGINVDDIGVSNVDLMIDGAIIYRTKIDCQFDAARGGYSNCYGLPSHDWTRQYPTLPDSDRATWRFVLDVGALLNMGYVEGSHTITIRADDFNGFYKNIDKINVFFQCDEHNPNEPSFGALEQPVLDVPYSGTVNVVGWALDVDGIAPNGIEIHVDDAVAGTTNPTIARPELADKYPGYSLTTVGFVFPLDTTKYHDGPVTIEVWVTDLLGSKTLIGEHKIILSNVVGP
jgi:hypothetical protein